MKTLVVLISILECGAPYGLMRLSAQRRMDLKNTEEASCFCSHSSSLSKKQKPKDSKYASDYSFITSVVHSEVLLLIFSEG